MEQGLPFPVRITNPETIKAIEEAVEDKNLSESYITPEEMFDTVDGIIEDIR